MQRPRPWPSRSKPQQHGLSRAEWLWIVGLGLGITLLILGTLRHDLTQAKVRRASDVLDYLTAQVHQAMQTADENQWPTTLVGPGEVPSELPLEMPLLADLLADTVFLPTDPWGHAYVISRQDAMKRPTWLVRSAGPHNQLPAAKDVGQALVRELIPPLP
jgi:hypothetical protein